MIPRLRALMMPASFLALGALGALLAACELPMLAGGSSSTETGKKVLVLGRVTGGAGEGISGVVVSLAGTTLADTTGLSGDYRVEGRAKNVAAGDTLLFKLHGQQLARKSLLRLQDSLPEMRFVQRGFSGRLQAGGIPVVRIAGVVTGDGIAPGDSVEATFYHNALAGNYSGFVYFPAPGDGVFEYTVHVNVHGEGGTRVGRSADVSFTSLAGNILIPDIILNNGPEPSP